MDLLLFLIIILLIVVLSPKLFGMLESFVPMFNIPTRNTRGMSYDLRCTPRIPKMEFPWMYGTMNPNHYGKCLEIV